VSQPCGVGSSRACTYPAPQNASAPSQRAIRRDTSSRRAHGGLEHIMRNFLPNAAGFAAVLDCNQSTCNAGHVWTQRLDLASKKRARVGCDHRGLCKPLGTGAGFGAGDHALKTSDNAAYSRAQKL